MKIGIILQSNKPEHIWNTFRLGITSLKANHAVTIFLMNEGSELDTIPDTEHFDLSKKFPSIENWTEKFLPAARVWKSEAKRNRRPARFPP